MTLATVRGGILSPRGFSVGIGEAGIRASGGDDHDDQAIAGILREAYDHEPFVHVSDAPPATKQTAGSNHAFVHGRRVGPRRAVVVSVIDNLGKGAAGQAIQNMTVALGLDETAGLGSLGIHP